MDFGGLKVLMVSSDRNILAPGSAVSERMKEYGALVDELHIVLMSDKSHGLKDSQLGKNVWVYPTNSSYKFRRPFCASRIGKKVVFDRKFVRGRSVITAQDPFECGWAGLKIKKKWRIPLEIQLHTDPFSPYFNGSLNLVRKQIAKKVVKKADKLRVVSRVLAERIKSEFSLSSSDISILPIYIDQKRIEDDPIAFDLHARLGWHFIMLAVARLAPEKNLSLAIEVLTRVRSRFPDAGLVIAGSGSEEAKLRSLAKSLGMETHVAFEGWQEKLGSYYKTATVYLQTSIFEGYGMSLVEAGLSGLPVISTPVGIALELDAGKDLYVCQAGDADCLANSVIDLIENNQKRENLRINMRNALESKLLTKEQFLAELKKNWEVAAGKVQ